MLKPDIIRLEPIANYCANHPKPLKIGTDGLWDILIKIFAGGKFFIKFDFSYTYNLHCFLYHEKSRKFKIMLKGSKPLFLVNITMLSIFALYDKFRQTNGFSPRSIQSSKIWSKSVNLTVLCGELSNFEGLHTKNHPFFKIAPRDQKWSAYLYWLYSGVQNPQKNISTFHQFNMTVKTMEKSSFCQKNQWKDENFSSLQTDFHSLYFHPSNKPIKTDLG